MTKKQMVSVLFLWIFTVGVFGTGFSWMVSSGDCRMDKLEIARLVDIQDNFLLSFGVFGNKEKLAELKTVIENRESLIKRKIENFKNFCRSSREQKQLISILKNYGIYLSMKQAVLYEKQDFSWHTDLLPLDMILKK
ncbi:MAG: hypothetical protein OXB86_06275 [Bdellovibrionales bacterium]|nr:hypothetical protein [Bdellovibrionales bacterium]